MDRSPGQKKLPFTLLPKRVVLYGDNTLDVPNDPFRRFRQVIVTKRNRDFLSNPKADRLVNALDCEYFIIFGMIAEHCVKAAALGLMARQRRVAVITDACGHWSRTESQLAFCQIEAKGAVLVTTDELITGLADERLRAAVPLRTRDEDQLDDDDIVDDIFHELNDEDPDRADLEDRGRRPVIHDKRRNDAKRTCGVAHRRELPNNGNGNGNGAAHGGTHPAADPSPSKSVPRRRPSSRKSGH